jgi:hypothetical protein
MAKMHDSEGASLPGFDEIRLWDTSFDGKEMVLSVPCFMDCGDAGEYDSEGVLFVDLESVIAEFIENDKEEYGPTKYKTAAQTFRRLAERMEQRAAELLAA